jgi:ATP-dependent exoDNAse (exonuclease V) beta subunit
VLWKLDGGIAHVLLDEAQDTSPAQWRILRHLTAEIFAGAGAVRPRSARCSSSATRSSQSTPSRAQTRNTS